ncbi:tetratricopeptide repeat protein [Magnetospirillum fulvum]|uniref:Tetratricopeptide repeat-containing protein n=1 Tax=Magnetospirillum fulvum TaxID=1082 RepID=A0A1H6HA93_MAGFU|nr:tetratricopeptide repeat protein [Magnetospirillum fulvum]SEH32721.1 Tetratricopeptide repeat-containing protein [Magnetospirillum fulvum]
MTKIRATQLAAAFLLFCVPLAACDDAADREAKYLRRGTDLFARGEFDKARIEFKNAARIKPTDPDVRYRLGLIDEAQGDLRNAFAAFASAESQDASFGPARLKLAQYYIAAEQYGEAETRINDVQAKDPDNVEAHALRAALLLRYKESERCEAEARAALAKDPGNITAISVLTGLYAAQGDGAKAGAILEEGIGRHPNDPSLQQLKIALFLRLDEFPKVEEAYRTLFQLRPAEVRYRLDLVDLYLKKGQIDAAEGALRSGITDPEGDWPLKQRLVVFLSENRGLDIAEKEVRQYLAQAPKKDELYFWLADLYIKHGAIDRGVDLLQQIVARNEFQTPGLTARASLARISFARGDRALAERLVAAVLDKAPTNRQALLLRAGMAFDKGQYQSAVSDLRAILREQAKDRDALNLLSEALLMQGRIDLAIDTLAHLVETAPLDPTPRVRLAQLYNVNADSARALDILGQVTRAHPTFAVAWESLARVKLSQKDIAGAIAAIDRLEALDGQRLTAQYLRGEALAAQDRLDDAIRQFSGVVSADPDTPLAEHALTALVGVYARQNRLEAASHFIDTLRTESPFVATVLGEIYLQRGLRDKAATEFDRALAQNPVRAEPYIDRARLYLLDRKVEAAIEIARRGTVAVPSSVPLSILLADIYSVEGRHQEALAIYEDLLARNPGLDLAANNAAELIADYKSNDPAAMERARQLAERFQGSSNPMQLDTLAWVYFRKGDQGKALVLANRLMSAEALPPQVHYHLAMILLGADRKAEAKTHLSKALEGNGPYPGIENAKQLIKTL